MVEQLNRMSPTRATAAVGQYAEQVRQIQSGREDWARQYLGVELPPAMVDSYLQKSSRMNRDAPLTEDELGVAAAVGVMPHVRHTIISMQRPDLARHLIQNSSLAGKLNAMHPLAAAGKLQSIADQLDSESSQQAGRSQLPRPIAPSRKSSSTDRALSDSLPTEEWAVRFKRKMGYEGS